MLCNVPTAIVARKNDHLHFIILYLSFPFFSFNHQEIQEISAGMVTGEVKAVTLSTLNNNDKCPHI